MTTSVNTTKSAIRFSFKESIHLLESSPSKESLIFLHFSSNGLRLKYSTGYKSSFKDWDFNRQRIKEGKSGIFNSREVNGFLSHLELNLKKEVSRLGEEGIVITKDFIKEYLDKLTNKNVVQVKPSKALTFFEFANSFIESKGSRITLITKRLYNQTVTKLREFEEHTGAKLDFNSFDKIFYSNFNNYMEDRGYSLNTIGKHVKNIKVILNGAVEDGLTTNLKFKNRDFRPKSEQTTAIYLSDAEIQKMFELDLSSQKHLELARDIFLIGCYTGQRVSDYNGLKSDSIKLIQGKKFITINQQKTKTPVNVPLSKKTQEIMDLRYLGEMPPKMNEQDINEYIKIVGEKLKFTTLVKVTSTKGGKVITEMIPKYKLIHTHTARRSFCTNMYLDQMPIIDIMLYSGHKGQREFFKYIRIIDEERAFHVSEMGYFDKY
ncbi:MAG: hypothetical protein EOO51_01395 [Flavobacterium sp.]|nr:MAG: hypothetical protein EOO51_01395 [Flavobacterium sp.]